MQLVGGTTNIGFDSIDSGRAISACEAAKEADPSNADVKAMLARALNAAGRYDDGYRMAKLSAVEGSAIGNLRIPVKMNTHTGLKVNTQNRRIED